MKRRRIGLALAATMASGAALAGLWPHARQAGAILAAQDDPAELSNLQVDSALQNSPNVVSGQIEAALAVHDTGLASSFVDLAGSKNISLPDDLVQRVNAAVAED